MRVTFDSKTNSLHISFADEQLNLWAVKAQSMIDRLPNYTPLILATIAIALGTACASPWLLGIPSR